MADFARLFQGAMVRALLEGRKTQTRRPLYTLQPMRATAHYHPDHLPEGPAYALTTAQSGKVWDLVAVPAPGDRLWVREAWRADSQLDKVRPGEMSRGEPIRFDADGGTRINGCSMIEPGKLRPSIFLPRWASRLTLPVSAVKIERLQDISEDDAAAEGIRFTDFGMRQPQGTMSIDGGRNFRPLKPQQHDGWHWDTVLGPQHCYSSARSAYAALWMAINGPDSWYANPWVYATTFDVEQKNIDA